MSERAPPPRPAPLRPSPRAPRAPSAPRGYPGSCPAPGGRKRLAARGWGSRAPEPRAGAAQRPGERRGGEGAPRARVGAREGARGSGCEQQAWEGEGLWESVDGVCARWTGCASAAAGASGKVCLGGERRGQAGRQQLSRRVGRVWRPARSREERLLREPLPAPLSGATGRRVWSRDRGPESGRLGSGTGRALPDCAPRESCSRPRASVSRPVTGDGRPERSHVPSARTLCARNPAAGCSLTLAAALYSGKCRGLPERPLRSQVAGGEAARRGQGLRPGARTLAARLRGQLRSHSQGGGRRGWLEAEVLGLCRSSPSIGKGPERKEVLPSGGTT